jgi:cytidylate kinase
MSIIIAVSGDDFSGGEALAAVLAEQFGFPLVTSATLVEHATRWGADRERLEAVFENPPGLLRRLTVDSYVRLRVLRGALGEAIRNRSLICYGSVSDLLPSEAHEVFRIQVQAAYPWRLRAVQDVLKLDRCAAQKTLRSSDRRQSRWRGYVYGFGPAKSPGRCDVTVNLEDMGIDGVCGIIEKMIAQRKVGTEARSAALQDFILASRIQADLALEPGTAHLEIDVQLIDGIATLRGSVRDPGDLSAAVEVVKRACGARPVDSSKMRLVLGAPDIPIFPRPQAPAFPMLAGTRSQSPSRPGFRLAYALAGISAVVLLSFVLIEARPGIRQGWHLRPSNPLQSFAGVVTDTLCIGGHKRIQPEANCVRACVRRPGVKYALYDGNRAYVLTDQLAGEKFAAREVVVKGFLDQNTGNLHVDSMQVASP